MLRDPVHVLAALRDAQLVLAAVPHSEQNAKGEAGRRHAGLHTSLENLNKPEASWTRADLIASGVQFPSPGSIITGRTVFIREINMLSLIFLSGSMSILPKSVIKSAFTSAMIAIRNVCVIEKAETSLNAALCTFINECRKVDDPEAPELLNYYATGLAKLAVMNRLL